MPEKKITLEVVTLEKTILREEGVDIVVFRRFEKENEIGSEVAILPGHAPLLARLSITPVRYSKSGKTYYIVVAGGFVRISNNQVSITTPAAERVEAVDLELAKAAEKRAKEWLEEVAGRGKFDLKKAEAELKGAMAEFYRETH
jgi:F-type H+-transporting ATPase subunit epsilon